MWLKKQCSCYIPFSVLRRNNHVPHRQWIPTTPLFKKDELVGEELNSHFRTIDSNPTKHDFHHLHKIYRLPWSEHEKLFSAGKCFRNEMFGQTASFQEFTLMIRKAALELMFYLKNTDIFNSPINHGPNGCGKSMLCCHILHYALKSDEWLIFHSPNSFVMSGTYKEVVPSTFSTKFDIPHESSYLLNLFKTLNKEKLEKYDIKTSKEYVWNKREKSVAGTPLLEVLQLGIERPVYASDIVGILLKELRLQSAKLKFKVLLVIEVANALFGKSLIPDQNKNYIDCNDVSVIHQIRKTLRNDWAGGAAICTVDNQYPRTNEGSFLPKSLLKSEGFDFFDPFIPIPLHNFNEEETFNMIDYYVERKWLNNPHANTLDGKKEIYYLTGGNGLDLYNFAKRW